MHTKKKKNQLSYIATATACSLLCVHSSSVKASVADTYGISARSMALGNANSAGDNSSHSAFLNPASLTNSKSLKITLSYLNQNLNLSDINSSKPDQNSGLSADQYRASQNSQINGASIGINLPIIDGINAGISAYMPRDNFGRLWGGAPSDTFYLRLADRQQRPAIFTAVGFDLPGGISLGLGSYYTLKASGQLQMALSPNGSAARFGLDMTPVFIPYGGLEWDVNIGQSSLNLGVTYRAEQSETASIDTNLTLNLDAATIPVSLQTSLAPFFDPETIKLAAAWQTGQSKLYTSLEFARWSNFKAPQIELKGNDIDAISKSQSAGESPLKDAKTYRLGYEYEHPLEASKSIAFRLGAERYESANSNNLLDKNARIIDPARTSLALGLAYQMPTYVDQQERLALFELSVQNSILDSKNFTTENSPETPAILASGRILSVVGGLSYEM